MRDGSDTIVDWPLHNVLISVTNGATWVSIHHGGDVAIGYSIHAGQIIVTDGTPQAAEQLQRALTSDPERRVIRHVDVDYLDAIALAKRIVVSVSTSLVPPLYTCRC